MRTMVPGRATDLLAYRVRLTKEPAAAAEARRQVSAAICAWDVAADDDVVILLTNELVTNAIKHTAGGPITLGLRCARGHLRVDVHDTSPTLPALRAVPVDAEAGRGLALVAALSADWGCYRTPAGKVVYFTLALQGPHDGP